MSEAYKTISKRDDESSFKKYWIQYLDAHQVHFRYLYQLIEFYIASTSSNIIDESFVIVANDRVEGLCFLPIEDLNGRKHISIGQGFVLAPQASSDSAEAFIFKKIEEVARNHKVVSIRMTQYDSQPFARFNGLRKYGFIDASTTNIIADLSRSKEQMWTGLRKSYKSYINGALKNPDLEFIVIDKDNADYNIHECYRELHHKCAGRVTRPKKSFDLQFEMLTKGNGLLIGLLKEKTKWVSLTYYTFANEVACYFSAADDPDYLNEVQFVHHVNVWVAMLELKKRNVRFLELEYPTAFNIVESLYDFSDQKKIGIAHFKRGMSSEMTSLFRGVRYFDLAAVDADLSNFRDRISEQINAQRAISEQ